MHFKTSVSKSAGSRLVLSLDLIKYFKELLSFEVWNILCGGHPTRSAPFTYYESATASVSIDCGPECYRL